MVALSNNLGSYMQRRSTFFSLVFNSLLISFSTLSYSEQISVGLEPFPPLVNEDGSGMVVDMLTTLSTGKNLAFDFRVMTYARAKKDLAHNNLNLIGLTPYQLETDEFYQFAAELNWHINTHVDFYALDQDFFNVDALHDGSIGTPIGNAEFFAEIIDVPVEKFVEVSNLEQLVKMLERGRLKVILFERVSTMSTIKALNIDKIYYKKMGTVPASLAVANTTKGLKLKNKLDKILANVENETFFNGFIHYDSTNVPDGVINSERLKKE